MFCYQTSLNPIKKGKKKKKKERVRITSLITPFVFRSITQQYPAKFSKNNRHFQYICKPPCNTMQATHLLQLNNPPQHNYQHHNIECLRMLTSSLKSNQQT